MRPTGRWQAGGSEVRLLKSYEVRIVVYRGCANRPAIVISGRTGANGRKEIVKSKGKSAWLITWEGPEAEGNGRCKVVTILRPQLNEGSIKSLLPILFSSEYNYTLCEKVGFIASSGRDPYFRQAYRDVNPELCYGEFPKQYLRARKVKNLRCEESQKNCFESTLYWTELPKFVPNPEWDPNGPMPKDLADLTKQVSGEREASYTYSIQGAVEREVGRKAEKGAV